MPFVETRLISPTTLTTSAASVLYTVPTGYSAIIKQLVVTNITGTAATFTFYIGAASAGNALFSGTSVAANDTVIINLSQVLSTGETLRALASTGSALNLTVSGVINDGPLASTATYIADNAITVNKIADGSVTTAKIAAGAVMDVDVNASAAIAQSKVANLTSDLALKAPLASPALTGAPTSTTAAVGTNTTQIATTAFANAAGGLVFIKSQAISSGVGTVTVTDAFSSLYDNYKILLRNGTSSTTANVGCTLGSTATGYNSTRIINQPSSAAVAGAAQPNSTSWVFFGQCGANYANLNVEIFNPNLSRYTTYNGTYSLEQGTNTELGFSQGMLANTTQYTSFTLTVSGATYSGGTILVYGYKQ